MNKNYFKTPSKNKLKQVLAYKPLETIENFMKKIEKNEYYKERIYDKDIYQTIIDDSPIKSLGDYSNQRIK